MDRLVPLRAGIAEDDAESRNVTLMTEGHLARMTDGQVESLRRLEAGGELVLIERPCGERRTLARHLAARLN